MSAARALAVVPDELPARLVTRISLDPNDKRTGVTRQRKLGRELADKLGWYIEHEHEDNNRSGWKEGVERAAFAELLADIRAGEVSAVIAYDQDRITRQSSEWGAFRRLCNKHGVRVAFVNDNGEVPIGTVSGGLSTGVRALLAEGESEIKSERIKAAALERVMGRGKACAHVAFGWRRVVVTDDRGNKLDWHDEVHPDQAPIVREIIERVARGDGHYAIARDLNARGVPTITQAQQHGRKNAKPQWDRSAIKALVRRPSNAGFVRWHGEVREDVQAHAPALVDPALWRRACAVLDDPARRRVNDPRLRHLLTTVSLCGRCDGPMRAKTIRRKATGYAHATYQCEFGHVTIAKDTADRAAAALIVAALGKLKMRDLATKTSDKAAQRTAAEVDRLVQLKSDLLAQVRSGVLSAADLAPLLAGIKVDLDKAQRAANASAAARPGAIAALSVAQAVDVATAWAALPLTTQRQVLADVLLLRVLPSLPGKRFADERRVSVELREV